MREQCPPQELPHDNLHCRHHHLLNPACLLAQTLKQIDQVFSERIPAESNGMSVTPALGETLS